MRGILILIGLVCVSLIGCVPNRKYVLVQKDDVHKTDMVRDSIVRAYALDPFDYKIQTNDLLSVKFESITPKDFNFLSPQTNMNVQTLSSGAGLLIGELVDDGGYIFFPHIGKVMVAGLTVFEIQTKLQGIANDYLENPVVKVRLLNYRVTALGELNHEGTIAINNNRASLLEVIGLAGGLTDLADRSKIKIIRQKGDQIEVGYIDILDENFINSPYYYVHQNDILVVPPLRQRTYRKYFGQNLALLVSSLTLLLLISNYSK